MEGLRWNRCVSRTLSESYNYINLEKIWIIRAPTLRLSYSTHVTFELQPLGTQGYQVHSPATIGDSLKFVVL